MGYKSLIEQIKALGLNVSLGYINTRAIQRAAHYQALECNLHLVCEYPNICIRYCRTTYDYPTALQDAYYHFAGGGTMQGFLEQYKVHMIEHILENIDILESEFGVE